MNLVKLSSAESYNEDVFIDPDDVSVIKRHHRDRDLGNYATIIMRSGEKINVVGLPLSVAELIRRAREDGKK